MRGSGDAWDLATSGAAREGVAGMAAGLVGGALFQGSLRLGALPNATWASLRRGLGGRSPIQTYARAALSPYALGGAGVGYASAFTGALTSASWEGGTWSEALTGAFNAADGGAVAGMLSGMLHPTGVQYWRLRFSPAAARVVEATRSSIRTAHHQRNIASYPEFASPSRGRDLTWFDHMNTLFTRGNVRGPDSTFRAPGSLTHGEMHQQWRFGQRGSPDGWSQFSTHGPWTPGWTFPRGTDSGALPANHAKKGS